MSGHTDEAEGAGDAVVGSIVEMHRELQPAKEGFRLHSKAFMLTYNGLHIVADTWPKFLQWFQALALKLGASEWSATLEESQGSKDKGRLHIHGYLSWGPRKPGVDVKSLAQFVFDGMTPRADANSENRGGWHWQQATNHGHFYVALRKKGTLQAETSYEAWKDYVPQAFWVVSLWKAHKLEHDEFELLSAKLADGHARRMQDLEAVRRTETRSSQTKRRAAALELLQPQMKKFKSYSPAILSWIERSQKQHQMNMNKIHNADATGPKEHVEYRKYRNHISRKVTWIESYKKAETRYSVLVLHGPSKLGKSELAKQIKGAAFTFVVDCQHARFPDLRSFDADKHHAVVCDEISGPRFVLDNKKVLQQHVDGAILGQSPTQREAYYIYLWRTPIIVTTNHWDTSTLSDSDSDWIAKNCVVEHVSEPVWVQ